MTPIPNTHYPIHDIYNQLHGNESSSGSSDSGSGGGGRRVINAGQTKHRTRPHTPPPFPGHDLPLARKLPGDHPTPLHVNFEGTPKHVDLPRIVTHSPTLSSGEHSPAGGLRSRWSPDTSSFPNSAILDHDIHSQTRSPLENHLQFVSSVSPSSSADMRERSGHEGRLLGPVLDSLSGGLSDEADDERSYETDSTLSLASATGSESDVDSPETDFSSDQEQKGFEDHNAREAELRDYFTHTSRTRTKKTAFTPKKKIRKAKYTHGHALQRMPGKVKGFSVQVPHYHHHLHAGADGIRQEGDKGDSMKRARSGTPGSAVPKRLRLDETDQGFRSGESSDEYEALGAAFVNLNLSETGRDVRVLVRSKQTKARAAGGSLFDYDRILDKLLVEEPMLFEDTDDLYHRKLIMYPRDPPQFMIKRLPLSSSELRVVLELNQAEVRNVAWNPAPRIICAVDRPRLCLISDKNMGDDRLGRPDDDVYLFFEPLEEVKKNPALKGAAEYLDMFRELLEGLTFLHEHHVAGFRCNLARSFMCSPLAGRTKTPATHLPGVLSPIQHADRDPGLLRYHFVDFAEAQRLGAASPLPSPITPTPTSIVHDGVMKDVQDLGSFLESTLRENTPAEVRERFTPLVTLMVNGRISADGARVMFMDVLRNSEVEEELKVKQASMTSRMAREVARPKKRSVLVKSVSGSEASQGESGYDIMDGEEDSDDRGHPQYYYPIGTDSDDPNYDSERSSDEGKIPIGRRGAATTTTYAIPGGDPRLTSVEIIPRIAKRDRTWEKN